MIRSILITLFVMLSINGPTFATSGKREKTPQTIQQVAPKQSSFSFTVDQIVEEYNQGKYTSFLEQVHADYIKNSQLDQYQHLKREPTKLSLLVEDYSQDSLAPKKQKIQALRENQNRELIEVCLQNPNTPLSHKVKDMIFYSPTREERESLNYLEKLSHQEKGQGTTPFENELIEISSEFWAKQIALEVSHIEEKLDKSDLQKQTFVLHLEKLHRMKEAAKKAGVDPAIKRKVEVAADIYPKVQSFSMTKKYLIALGKNEIPPKTKEEKAFQKVIQKYSLKEDELLSAAIESKK